MSGGAGGGPGHSGGGAIGLPGLETSCEVYHCLQDL